jgi:DNA-binding NarL/FixJ family response regulator
MVVRLSTLYFSQLFFPKTIQALPECNFCRDRAYKCFMKKHILLIERSRDGYRDFMNVLEATNIDCKVTYTDCYEHALEMLKYLIPDCIFMRIDISEQNAIDCVKQIRDHKSLGSAKVVVYDDEVTSKMIKESILHGADYCIDRPSTYADFSYLLKDVFRVN